MAKHFSSIRTKLILFISITLFFSLMMAMTGMYLFQKSTLTGQTVERAEEIGSIINTSLKYQMLKRDFELTQRIINEISTHKNVRSAFIINEQGTVKFSSRPEQLDNQLNKSDKQCLPCHDRANNEARLTLHKKDVVHAFRHDESALTNVTLIYNEKPCFGCHAAKEKILGHLFIDYSTAGMDSLIATTMLRMLATAFVTLIIMTLAILYLINRWLHKPITILMDGVSELKKGHYGSQVDYRGNTEFRVLTDSFNVMSKNIQANIREIKNKGFELNVLYAIVKKISESIYLEELKVVVVDILIELMNCDRCIIFTPSLKADVYEVTEMNKGSEPFKSLINLADLAKASEREGEKIIALFAKWVNNEISAPLLSPDALVASLPLVIRDSRLGLIVAVRNAANPFDEEGFRLVTVARDHLAVAFENARLYTLAITDELTHFFTLRHFQSQMEIEISRFLRYGQKCSLLMLDIDKFKAVNDTYGHPAGDKVLKEVAAAIRNNLREIDIPCRYGGEEFTVILPGTSENGARLVAERIRKSVEKTVIPLDETRDISVTISIGGACCPEHGAAVKDMVVTADKALYRAKEAGRNKVFWGHKENLA